MARKPNLDALREALHGIPPGPIDSSEAAEVEERLAAAWHELQGSSAEGTADDKMIGRTEDLRWNPPVLSFTIERHGGYLQGSSRAEIHDWMVDIEQGTAHCATGRYRQLTQRQTPVDIARIVDEIVQHIDERSDHPALTWKSPDRVMVTLSHALPHSDNQQSQGNRRRRLGKRLTAALWEIGWRRVPGTTRYEFEQAEPPGLS